MNFDLLEREPRRPVWLGATVSHDDGRKRPVMLTDLSEEGCCLSGAFAIGERVTLSVPNLGVFPAVIRWAFMDRAGARFRATPAGEMQ